MPLFPVIGGMKECANAVAQNEVSSFRSYSYTWLGRAYKKYFIKGALQKFLNLQKFYFFTSYFVISTHFLFLKDQTHFAICEVGSENSNPVRFSDPALTLGT